MYTGDYQSVHSCVLYSCGRVFAALINNKSPSEFSNNLFDLLAHRFLTFPRDSFFLGATRGNSSQDDALSYASAAPPRRDAAISREERDTENEEEQRARRGEGRGNIREAKRRFPSHKMVVGGRGRERERVESVVVVSRRKDRTSYEIRLSYPPTPTAPSDVSGGVGGSHLMRIQWSTVVAAALLARRFFAHRVVRNESQLRSFLVATAGKIYSRRG